jgi:hypothetical protein
MKPKRVKMLRRQRKKELISLCNQVGTQFQRELGDKITAMLPNKSAQWSDLIALIKYYIAKTNFRNELEDMKYVTKQGNNSQEGKEEGVILRLP